ncbi:MAG: flagellar hook capping protein [Gammaproteobacteria bacterium]|nr:flagellar hook capping protein [Gammaproteobacteria bacterium]MDH5800655.1 flagellar hook capping protein [Gammaproteobacteria bacterium]
MAVESIGTNLTSPQQQVQNAGIGQEDLFKILLTQLTYQDPLKPLDNQEFIAQLAQFSSLEQTRESNENLTALLTMQAAEQSIGLIGKTVQVETENGGEVGDVIAVRFQQGKPLLTVNFNGVYDQNVSLAQISLVSPGEQSTAADTVTP